MRSPELELASPIKFVAAKCHLWGAIGEHIENLAVRNVAYLVVLNNRVSARITRHVAYRYVLVVEPRKVAIR